MSQLRALGREIRQARLQHGLTLAELADAVGVYPSAVHYYETGCKEPGALRLLSLAEVLRLDLRLIQRRVRRAGRPSRAS